MIDPVELRELAGNVAREVGREVLRRRQGSFSWETKSSPTDVVTEIDIWAEREVVAKIAALRPDDGFLGEEGTSRPGTTGLIWVIDPVDGTTNLFYDLPGYGVSIAASIDEEVVAGAVFDPIRDELFTSAKGRGATRNGDAISVSSKTDLSTSLIGTGFSYYAEERIGQVESLVKIIPLIRDIRRAGGAALDLCYVACGRLDACYERGLSRWDSAAGALIAAEAGAKVLEGELTAAAAPGIADALFDLLADVDA